MLYSTFTWICLSCLVTSLRYWENVAALHKISASTFHSIYIRVYIAPLTTWHPHSIFFLQGLYIRGPQSPVQLPLIPYKSLLLMIITHNRHACFILLLAYVHFWFQLTIKINTLGKKITVKTLQCITNSNVGKLYDALPVDTISKYCLGDVTEQFLKLKCLLYISFWRRWLHWLTTHTSKDRSILMRTSFNIHQGCRLWTMTVDDLNNVMIVACEFLFTYKHSLFHR